MRVTLRKGGNLSYRDSKGRRVRLEPGDTALVPRDVAERYAHRFTFKDEASPPEPQVEVREETTPGPTQPSDGAIADDGDGTKRTRKRARKSK